MAMLDRYRKKGGFIQLLILLETCGPAKQEKFLEIIRSEDHRWADQLKSKMLDLNRIYSWGDETLAEVFGTLQDLTVAMAVHAAGNAFKERVFKFMSHGRQRKINDIIEMSNTASAEIASAHIKIIESVRKMAIDGYLRFEKFDPDLILDEDIEEKLSKQTLLAENGPLTLAFSSSTASSPAFKTDTPVERSSSSHESSEAHKVEVANLNKKITELGKENAMLRHELSIAKGKLEQIKKIA